MSTELCNIITSFYIPINDSIRETELKTALNNNLENQSIHRIHLFLDKELDKEYIDSLATEKREKIVIIKIGSQPLYSDLFNYANENLKNEICLITNGDISLQTSIEPKFIYLLKNNYIFALTRYEQDKTSLLISDYDGSHDMFIFKSPLNKGIERLIQHKQNIWGSENRVIDILFSYKYKLINPCFQIKIVHHHDMKRANRIENNRPRLPFILNIRIPPCRVQYVEKFNKIIFIPSINRKFKLKNLMENIKG